MKPNLTLESFQAKVNSLLDAINEYETWMKNPSFHRSVEIALASHGLSKNVLEAWLTSHSLPNSNCIVVEDKFSISGDAICQMALNRTCAATEVIEEIVNTNEMRPANHE